jgi:hypothetical protein
MSKKHLIRVVGKTSDGRSVVSGVYRYFESTGLPLADILEQLEEKAYVPCWLSYMDEATRAGMKPARALAKLRDGMGDFYTQDFRDTVLSRLEDTFVTKVDPGRISG